MFVLGIRLQIGLGGSWGAGEDIDVRAKSADYVASKLEIPDFTGDLLFKYVLDYLKPSLDDNGDTPLRHRIDELKVKGVIPTEPQQHLWYYAWNYTLKTGKNRY